MAAPGALPEQLAALPADDARGLLRTLDRRLDDLPLEAAAAAEQLAYIQAAARTLRRCIERGDTPDDIELARAAELTLTNYWWRRRAALNMIVLPGEPASSPISGALSMIVWAALAYLRLALVFNAAPGIKDYVDAQRRAHAEWLEKPGAIELLTFEGETLVIPAPVAMQPRDMARLYTLLGLRWRTYTYADAPLLTELLERVRERALLLSVLDRNVILGTPAVSVFEATIAEIRAYAFGYQLWLLRQFRVETAANVLRDEPREVDRWCAAMHYMADRRYANRFDGVRNSINADLRRLWLAPGAREICVRERHCTFDDVDDIEVHSRDMDRYKAFLDVVGSSGSIQRLIHGGDPNSSDVARIHILLDYLQQTYNWPGLMRHVYFERNMGGEYPLAVLLREDFVIAQVFNSFAFIGNGRLVVAPDTETTLTLFFWFSRHSAYAYGFPALYRTLAHGAESESVAAMPLEIDTAESDDEL